MNIESVSSMPEYIHNFISNHKEKLKEIYAEGMNQYNEGMLVFQCSEKNNKMEVIFMNSLLIYDKLMTQEKYQELQQTISTNKQVLYVIDEDISSVFLLYV